MSDEPVDLVPRLEASLLNRLPVLIAELRQAEDDILAANTKRKAAKNKIAELLQGLGLTGFSLRND